jgi:phosphoketolase
LADGAVVLQETAGAKQVVFAVIGDMTLLPVYEAASELAKSGIGSKIVSVINPRRLYRPSDVGWASCSEADGGFLDDAKFQQIFGGSALIGVTGGASAMLEPMMLRSNSPRDTFAWQRGETTASAGDLMAFNGLTAAALAKRGMELIE